MPYIPLTVFTGFLGAGKTSIILSLLPQLPKEYKVVLLKNEFGDVEDSQLAKQSALTAVSEILNGCMCCVLVGQMKNALLEIREIHRPDRIFIECSGSAFPATLAFQIRELERETSGDFKLDAIVTVIDAENFTGYEDTSPTAKMQATYTDIILINKWEHVSPRQLDLVLDHLHTLNDLTPKIRCNGRNGVDPDLIFGLESKLFTMNDHQDLNKSAKHSDEVQVITLYRGRSPCGKCRFHNHVHNHGDHSRVGCNHEPGDDAHDHLNGLDTFIHLSQDQLSGALKLLKKESVWRVKGFVRLSAGIHILNWAFGRFDLTETDSDKVLDGDDLVLLTVMGERGEVRRAVRGLAVALGAEICT